MGGEGEEEEGSSYLGQVATANRYPTPLIITAIPKKNILYFYSPFPHASMYLLAR